MSNIISHEGSEAMRSTLSAILAAAETKQLKEKELAQLAGIRPETLSRMKRRGSGDFTILDRLAHAVGMKLAAVPDDDQLERIQQGRFFS
jgi:DNA-binding Xre family transcriptional regulator